MVMIVMVMLIIVMLMIMVMMMMFRIACELALSVMRKEKDVLMSMLRPFVFDPLVD